MPNLATKDNCCGCAACSNICPLHCITMVPDKTGFLYPRIDMGKCINCNKCVKACPALQTEEIVSPTGNEMYCVVQNKDDRVLMESTSGGAFTAFAQTILDDDGVVYGAVMDDKFHVRHKDIRNIAQLGTLRSSKYVQSEIGTTFQQAETDLKAGRAVIFSGTPCQIRGLLKYLGKEYENLTTVDLMCRAVPSPKIFQKYVDFVHSRFDKVDKLVFRDKYLGYSYSTLSVYGSSGDKQKEYHRGKESDEWLRLFLSGVCNRPSCYRCRYQTGRRRSDITMWDCFRVYQLAPMLDNNRGATNVIAWSDKGKSLIKASSNNLRISLLQLDPHMPNLFRGDGKNAPPVSQEFYDDAQEMEAEDFFAKYAPNTFTVTLKNFARKAFVKLHLHDAVRKSIHKIRDIKKSRNRGR